MIERGFDQDKAEAFEQKIVDILNNGCAGLMVSVGHRTGLFDVMSNLGFSTSEEIASSAGLNERYVREWLGAMVTAGIVDYRFEDNTFLLCAEHAGCLTRKAAPNNLAAFTQYLAVLGAVETNIVEAFKHGKGVPYSAYERFHEVMAEDSGQTVVAALLQHILPLVDGLESRLGEGINAADIGCGSGRAVVLMGEHFPMSRFAGLDFSAEAIETAKSLANEKGLTNVRFEVRDAAQGFGDNMYDLITAFDAIHDQAKPQRVLGNIYRALGDDGVFLMQDIAASSRLGNNLEHPLGPCLYTISCMHCMSVSLANGGPGLGAMWGKEKALDMLGEAGFGEVEVKQLPHDIQNYYYIASKK